MTEVQHGATHDVFISYSAHGEDKLVANAVCAKLESRNIRCWIAPRDATPGKPFAEEIIDGINKTNVFVLVFSRNSNTSPHIVREVGHAVSKGIPIIPLRIEEVDPDKSLEYFLSDTHWLDALTPPLNAHLEKLSDTVELFLGQNVGKDKPAVAKTQPASEPAKPAAKRSFWAKLTGGRLQKVLIAIVLLMFLFAAGTIFSEEMQYNYEKQADRAFLSTEYEDAIKLYEKSFFFGIGFDYFGDHPYRSMYRQALSYMKIKRNKKALQVVNLLLDKDFVYEIDLGVDSSWDEEKTLMLRARIKHEMDNDAAAKADLKRVLAKEPENKKALAQLKKLQ